MDMDGDNESIPPYDDAGEESHPQDSRTNLAGDSRGESKEVDDHVDALKYPQDAMAEVVSAKDKKARRWGLVWNVSHPAV